jgi:hypothetical protein
MNPKHDYQIPHLQYQRLQAIAKSWEHPGLDVSVEDVLAEVIMQGIEKFERLMDEDLRARRGPDWVDDGPTGPE